MQSKFVCVRTTEYCEPSVLFAIRICLLNIIFSWSRSKRACPECINRKVLQNFCKKLSRNVWNLKVFSKSNS